MIPPSPGKSWSLREINPRSIPETVQGFKVQRFRVQRFKIVDPWLLQVNVIRPL